MFRIRCAQSAFFLLFFVTPPLAAVSSVSLISSPASPAPLGTIVHWQAEVDGSESADLRYRFRARRAGDVFRMIQDYGPNATIAWSPIAHEGKYEVEISVQDAATGETVTSIEQYELTPIAQGDGAKVIATVHPLVFFYAAPPCRAGRTIHVEFESGEGYVQNTPDVPCGGALTNNFYIAGLRADTRYSARHIVSSATGSISSPPLSFQTGPLSLDLAAYSVLQPPSDATSMGVLLQSPLNQMIVATDLLGNIIWFYAGTVQSLTRPAAGGGFFGFTQIPTAEPSSQFIRKCDFLGIPLLETNAARINEQLTALGKRPITSFHHEVRELPDGKILVLANVEQVLDNVQEPGKAVVLGDAILVLDEDMQLVWSWDAFDFLDPARKATMDETCTPASGGCPSFYLGPEAEDWLHGNSLQLTPDGNILYSSRHQDWLLKIDYRNGDGDGNILWRLGKDGDFWMDSTTPAPWFSHQHDAHFLAGDPTAIAVFDNGNARKIEDPNANSRGQILHLDEESRTASLSHNFDLGAYSAALGSAQKLPNGHYHFLSGFINGSEAEALEFDPDGNIVYRIRVNTQLYRAFRMQDLYTPPQ